MEYKLTASMINKWPRCTDHTHEHIEEVYADGLTASQVAKRDIKPFYKAWLLVHFMRKAKGDALVAEYVTWCKANAKGRSIYLCNACIPTTRCGARLHGNVEITEDMVKADAEMWNERIDKLVQMIDAE